MKKMKIININNYNYTFLCEGKEYVKNIEFQGVKLNEGDIVYFPDGVANEINLFTYGPLLKDTKSEDAIKVVQDGKEIFMTRYYG